MRFTFADGRPDLIIYSPNYRIHMYRVILNNEFEQIIECTIFEYEWNGIIEWNHFS
jgi:hypothetical protein